MPSLYGVTMAVLRAARLALRWSYPWMIVQWVAVHYVWAYGMFRDYDAIKPLVAIAGIQTFVIEWGINPSYMATLMVIAATCALIGLLFEASLPMKLIKGLMMPQYGLVFAAFLADGWLVINGVENSQGNPVNPVIVHVLLLPIITGAVFHTFSIIERFVLDKAHVSATPQLIEHNGEKYEAYLVR